MTTFVARVSTEAKDIHPGRAILAAIAGVFFAVGWILAKVWLAVAWLVAAVVVGWVDAGGPGRKAATGKRGG